MSSHDEQVHTPNFTKGKPRPPKKKDFPPCPGSRTCFFFLNLFANRKGFQEGTRFSLRWQIFRHFTNFFQLFFLFLIMVHLSSFNRAEKIGTLEYLRTAPFPGSSRRTAKAAPLSPKSGSGQALPVRNSVHSQSKESEGRKFPDRQPLRVSGGEMVRNGNRVLATLSRPTVWLRNAWPYI